MYFLCTWRSTMLLITTPEFTLKTRYYMRNNGQDYYQRPVPLALRKFFNDQTRIRRKLSGKLSSLTVEIARMAQEDNELFARLRNASNTDLAEAEAKAILATYGVSPGDGLLKAKVPDGMYDQPHLDDIEHYLMVKRSKGTLSDTDKLAEHLLTKPLPISLSKSLQVYYENHPKGTSVKFKTTTHKHFKRVLDDIGDIPIEKISRAMAKEFVNKRLKEVSTNTVQRQVNTIRAILNIVIRENELNISNPFEHIVIPNLGKDKIVRQPFQIEELQLLIDKCIEKGDQLRVILLLCAITGARLSEIVGLRKIDLKLDQDIATIKLVEYNNRTLKTKNSHREIPLVPIGKEVLQKYVTTLESELLFPRYNDGDDVNGNAASGAANNYIKSQGIKDKTAHCLRHTMRDLFRRANIGSDIANEIGGWGSQSIGERYGDGYALTQKYDAIMKALSPVFNIN